MRIRNLKLVTFPTVTLTGGTDTQTCPLSGRVIEVRVKPSAATTLTSITFTTPYSVDLLGTTSNVTTATSYRYRVNTTATGGSSTQANEPVAVVGDCTLTVAGTLGKTVAIDAIVEE